jgi:hypothetical protein
MESLLVAWLDREHVEDRLKPSMPVAALEEKALAVNEARPDRPRCLGDDRFEDAAGAGELSLSHKRPRPQDCRIFGTMQVAIEVLDDLLELGEAA